MTIVDGSGRFLTDHFAQLTDLFGQTFRVHHPAKDSFSEDFFREQIEKKIAYVDQGSGKVFCAVSGDGIVGFIHIYIQPFLDEKRLIVADFVVDSRHRRQGIGTMLIQRAEDYAKSEACDSICLMAANMENTLSFYRSSGYLNSRVEMVKRLN